MDLFDGLTNEDLLGFDDDYTYGDDPAVDTAIEDERDARFFDMPEFDF